MEEPAGARFLPVQPLHDVERCKLEFWYVFPGHDLHELPERYLPLLQEHTPARMLDNMPDGHERQLVSRW